VIPEYKKGGDVMVRRYSYAATFALAGGVEKIKKKR
jgi:hypothetical protein